jgi:hypothetical protein
MRAAIFILFLAISSLGYTQTTDTICEVKLQRCNALLRDCNGTEFVLRDKYNMAQANYLLAEAERKNLAANVLSLQLEVKKGSKKKWVWSIISGAVSAAFVVHIATN